MVSLACIDYSDSCVCFLDSNVEGEIMRTDKCEISNRYTLMRFDYDKREYRVISNIISQQRDLEIFIEQHVDDMWLRIPTMLDDKNKMTIEQCAQIIKQISDFVNENFYLI